LIIVQHFPIRSVIPEGSLGQFHPVLEFHPREVSFTSRKWSIRQFPT
jgi:hypothetical protein